MTIDIDELERKARAANDHVDSMIGWWSESGLREVGPGEIHDIDAAHVAAASPAVMLDLCVELRRLQRYERAVTEALMEGVEGLSLATRFDLRADIARRMEEP